MTIIINTKKMSKPKTKQNAVVDCVVMRVQEVESAAVGTFDSDIFIMWDTRTEQFFVCGKRADKYHLQYNPFSYKIKRSKDADLFVKQLAGESKLRVTFYNFSDLAKKYEDIYYEDLVSDAVPANEMVGYKDEAYNSEVMLTNLRMLKTALNYY